MPRTFTHSLHPRPFANIQGSDHLYPVRRIFCVGRNYADHAREMGAILIGRRPFLYQVRRRPRSIRAPNLLSTRNIQLPI